MIDVLNLSSADADTKELKRVVSCVLKGEGVEKEVELSVVLLNRSAMAELNKKHRQEQGATDVLSFDFNSSVPERTKEELPVLNLGQVFICPAVVKKRLKTGEELKQSLMRTLVHGLLHVLGYNHKRKEEEMAMMEKQDFYIKKAGFNL